MDEESSLSGTVGFCGDKPESDGFKGKLAGGFSDNGPGNGDSKGSLARSPPSDMSGGNESESGRSTDKLAESGWGELSNKSALIGIEKAAIMKGRKFMIESEGGFETGLNEASIDCL